MIPNAIHLTNHKTKLDPLWEVNPILIRHLVRYYHNQLLYIITISFLFFFFNWKRKTANVFVVPCFLTKLAARLIYNFAIDIVFPTQKISLEKIYRWEREINIVDFERQKFVFVVKIWRYKQSCNQIQSLFLFYFYFAFLCLLEYTRKEGKMCLYTIWFHCKLMKMMSGEHLRLFLYQSLIKSSFSQRYTFARN